MSTKAHLFSSNNQSLLKVTDLRLTKAKALRVKRRRKVPTHQDRNFWFLYHKSLVLTLSRLQTRIVVTIITLLITTSSIFLNRVEIIWSTAPVGIKTTKEDLQQSLSRRISVWRPWQQILAVIKTLQHRKFSCPKPLLILTSQVGLTTTLFHWLSSNLIVISNQGRQ